MSGGSRRFVILEKLVTKMNAFLRRVMEDSKVCNRIELETDPG